MFPLQAVIWTGVILTFMCPPSWRCHDPPHPRKLKLSTVLNDAYDTDESTTRDIVVEFKQKPSHVLSMMDMTSRAGGTKVERAELHKNFMEELKLMTRESQGDIVQFLKGEAEGRHESFWVSNQIFVKGASKELAEALASFENVEAVKEERIYFIHRPMEEGPVVEQSRVKKKGSKSVGINAENLEWNIRQVHAFEAWQKGAGEPCTVGVIDTGVRDTHEAFEGVKFVGWKDAVNKKASYYDDNGHGTHVTGIIAGVNGIGVTGGLGNVQIISCKACTASGSCSQSALTSCCQFMTEKRPFVVSNSWGGPSGDSPYISIINSWKALNMVPVFSAGNEGPECDTIGSPGDAINVISVGSTNSENGLSEFSSRGQCLSGMMGPTVCAPGQSINSAWMTSDTSYKAISGTSMAAPHVSGLCAIMFSHNPSLTFAQVKNAVVKSCVKSDLTDTEQTCGGTSFNKFPNNMYGNGRIDCMQALQALKSIQADN